MVHEPFQVNKTNLVRTFKFYVAKTVTNRVAALAMAPVVVRAVAVEADGGDDDV